MKMRYEIKKSSKYETRTGTSFLLWTPPTLKVREYIYSPAEIKHGSIRLFLHYVCY